MKKNSVLDGIKNHKCQQTAWMRSVSRALELISNRLKDVEKENFILRLFIGAAVFVILGIAAVYGYRYLSGSQNPVSMNLGESTNYYGPVELDSLEENDRLTTRAWNVLNEGDSQQAIDLAQQCIDRYSRLADDEQRLLIESGTPFPHIGKIHPLSKDEIDAIMSRGLLNNVAACYFIQGLAFEKLDRLDDAKDAYRRVRRYVHARVYDPNEKKFWSPEQAGQDKLKALKDRLEPNPPLSTPISLPIQSG